ncbi:MAG: hypothetical protein NZ534_12405, partial [Bacteroidia bacterium]|nr:hypothetical protein [Bacteroidia bacterium]
MESLEIGVRKHGETHVFDARFEVSGAGEYSLALRNPDGAFRVLSPARYFDRPRDTAAFYVSMVEPPPIDRSIRFEWVFSDGKSHTVRHFDFVPNPGDERIAAPDFALETHADARWRKIVFGDRVFELRRSGFVAHRQQIVRDDFRPLRGFERRVGWGDVEAEAVFSDDYGPIRQTFFAWDCDQFIVVEYDREGGVFLDAGMREGRYKNGTVVLNDGQTYIGLTALWGETRGGVVPPNADDALRLFPSDTIATDGAAAILWATAFALTVAESEAEIWNRVADARYRYACQYAGVAAFVENASFADEIPRF